MGLGQWMFNSGRGRFERGAKVGLLAVLALIVALAALSSSPAEARRSHRRAMPAGLTDPAKDAALIMDGETGKVLYARNAAAERHPASLTKMMTLYLLFDALKRGQITLATPLTFSSHAASQRPTKLHVSVGDTIQVDDAIRAIRLLCQLVADACIEGQQERTARVAEVEAPEPVVEPEPEPSEAASQELVAALAGGGALTFEPEVDEEEILLPGTRVVPTHPRSEEAEEKPRTH